MGITAWCVYTVTTLHLLVFNNLGDFDPLHCNTCNLTTESLATFWVARPTRSSPSATRRRNLPSKSDHHLSAAKKLSLMIRVDLRNDANRPHEIRPSDG